MIQYKNISAWYPTLTTPQKVLDNCSFHLRKGSITALSGLNGSGKTTLLKVLLGISKFSSGDLFYREDKKKSIIITNFFRTGYAPETTSDSMKISPVDLFKFTDLLTDNEVPKASAFSPNRIIQTFDLEEYASTKFDKLSKGTKKRVLIANAFLNNPEVLILDEPFEGLDQKQRSNLKDLLIKYREEKIVLVSSHELLELKTFCDDHLHIENKKIIPVYE